MPYYNMSLMADFQCLPAETVQFLKDGFSIYQLSPLADFQLVLIVGDLLKPLNSFIFAETLLEVQHSLK